jgi:hypothetical protein
MKQQQRPRVVLDRGQHAEEAADPVALGLEGAGQRGFAQGGFTQGAAQGGQAFLIRADRLAQRGYPVTRFGCGIKRRDSSLQFGRSAGRLFRNGLRPERGGEQQKQDGRADHAVSGTISDWPVISAG